jgi:hypothetical protein
MRSKTSEDKELADFAAMIAGEIRDRETGDATGAEFRETAFVEYVSELLEEIGAIENAQACYLQTRLGTSVVRLNGYAISDDGDRLDLLTAVFLDAEQPQSVSLTELNRAAAQAARAIEAAKRGLHKDMERATDSYSMMAAISEALKSGIKDIRILLLTDGVCSVRKSKPLLSGSMEFRFDVYDLRRLVRSITSRQSRDVIDIELADLKLDPIQCLAKPGDDKGCEVYMAIVPGEVLYRLYNEFGARLLEFNVRSFLQASGKVNRGIRDSLKEEPEFFMAYNNGISMTVDELTTKQTADRGLVITRMKGLQIVNGGQTTASIHRARKRDNADLSQVYVAAKITRLTGDMVDVMVPKISRYANTQNVIQEADFSANEPFHIALERLSEKIWCPGEGSRWFYERARGQYRTAMNLKGSTPAKARAFKDQTPGTQKINKTDMAKFLNSWDQLPHVVSAGAQKNFVTFMRNLRERDSSWEPDESFFKDLIAKAILFNSAARIVRKEAFPAYRANIVCYLVAYLSYRAGSHFGFERLWQKQAVSAELESLLRQWSHPVANAIQESAGGKNITEWCKKDGCWNFVRALELSMDSMPPELASVASTTKNRR